MPNILNDSTQVVKLNEVEYNVSYPNREVLAPVALEAIPTGPKSINLSWKDPRIPEEKLAGYYMVCYAEVKMQQSCENGTNNFIKR